LNNKNTKLLCTRKLTRSTRILFKPRCNFHTTRPENSYSYYLFWGLGVTQFPESYDPFSKLCQRQVEAVWMVRRALLHRMCDQRRPVDDMIFEIRLESRVSQLLLWLVTLDLLLWFVIGNDG